MISKDDITVAVLTYAPAFVGGFLWGFAKFPEQLSWASDLYARSFGLVSAVYEDWTQLPGYGDPLNAAIDEVRSSPRKVLDVATGTGYAARRIKQRFPEAEVTGFDISSEMISIAQHQAVAESLDIRFIEADSSSLPFDDGEFDVVVLQNSIPYPEEMMRVTAPGGRAIVAFSFAGPWVKLAWPALAERFERAGAEYMWGSTQAMGYFGVARKASSAYS